jgi:hypothetical protein
MIAQQNRPRQNIGKWETLPSDGTGKCLNLDLFDLRISMIIIPPDVRSGFVRYNISPLTTFVDRPNYGA